MIKKILTSLTITGIVAIIPALSNTQILYSFHILVLIIFGFSASMLQPHYNPFSIIINPKDHGTGAQIIWSVYIIQLLTILESSYLRYPESIKWNIISITALIAMILGLSLRTWAVYTLGPLFTMHLSIQTNHTIIKSGPYRIFNHPSYTGAFLMYIATTLFFHAWYSFIIGVAILPIAFLRRIHYEDAMLKNKFGDNFRKDN